MKKLILATSLLLATQTSFATTLTCIEKMANTITQKMTVNLELGKRAPLFSGDGNASYVTEKNLDFSRWSFLWETANSAFTLKARSAMRRH